jgi:hypothetical protein
MHRVVGIVLQELTAVTEAEHATTGAPDLRQDALLLGHLPSQAIERREHDALDPTVLDGFERFVKPCRVSTPFAPLMPSSEHQSMIRW